MKIAALFGGTSEERDDSIAGAAQIIPALCGLGYEVSTVDTATGLQNSAAERRPLATEVALEPPIGHADRQRSRPRRRARPFVDSEPASQKSQTSYQNYDLLLSLRRQG